MLVFIRYHRLDGRGCVMKIIAVIPARYNSTRFPGKPLADICGRPMIWWVYNQVKKAKKINEVYIATDDRRIANVCINYNMQYRMTGVHHCTSTERVYEVAKNVASDLYIVVNGDEPLINPQIIESIIPKEIPEEFFVSNLMTEISNPGETIDFTNIKVVTDHAGFALFMSRSPIPYPKASIDYKYYKHVGVLAYDIAALKFFHDTPKGYNEKIEDINELRFIEHGKKIKMIEVKADSLSVDTHKDLEYIRKLIKKESNYGQNQNT